MPQYGPKKYTPMLGDQNFATCYQPRSAQEPARENQDFGFKSEVSKVLLKNLQRQKFYEISEKKTVNISESLKLFCVGGKNGGEGSTRKGSTSGSEEDAVSVGGDFDYDAELKNLPFITNWLVEDDC
jgi:hypothetical protein